MRGLDTRTLQRFVELVGKRLEGRWIVIGGAVFPLLGVTHRVTVDIDIAGPEDAARSQTLTLMDLTEELGLPVEAINQAGDFFLRRIRGWEDHLVEIHRGPRASIQLPDATLFLLLKLNRLSEADLGDCEEMLKLARRLGDPIDTGRIRRTARQALARAEGADRRQRLEALLRLL